MNAPSSKRRSARRTRRSLLALGLFMPPLVGLHVLGMFLVASELDRAPEGRALSASSPGKLGTGAPPELDDQPLEIERFVDELEQPVVRSASEKRAEEKKKAEEERKDAKGQVVEIARPTIEQSPEQARFVAEYDSKVDKETKGRPSRDKAGATVETLPQPGRKADKTPSGHPLAQPGRVGPPSARTRDARHQPSGTRGQNGDPEGGSDDAVDGTRRRSGTPGEGRATRPLPPGEGGLPGPRGVPNLTPSDEILSRAIGHGSGSLDHLRDVDDGDGTALNARKWKYASFFNRVKRAVADQWHPDTVYLRHDPSGRVYGNRDRSTLVRVHLHPDGKIDSISMLTPSGVEFLDEEAMDALRRAQPFPNPPSALVDSDGLIHFTFGFTFELSGHTTFKLFKYN